eukprot:g872.t1
MLTDEDRDEKVRDVQTTNVCVYEESSFQSVVSASALKLASGRSDLTEIRSLDLQVNTTDESLQILGDLVPNLESLKLNGSIIPSCRDLGTRLHCLRVLWLSRCGLDALDGIGALASLQELYVSFNDIQDLTPLAFHEQLQILDLDSNAVESLKQVEQLATCSKIRTLTLESNSVALVEDYRRVVHTLVPQIEVLDDVRITAIDDRSIEESKLNELVASWDAFEETRRDGSPPASRRRRDIRRSCANMDEEAMMVADCTRMQSRLLALEAKRHGATSPPIAVSSPTRPDDARLFRSPSRRARSAQSPARNARIVPSLGKSTAALDSGHGECWSRRPHTAGEATDLRDDLLRYRSYMLTKTKARSPAHAYKRSVSSPHASSPRRPRMLELLEELGVMPEEYPQYFGEDGVSSLTHGTSVTFRGNPIRAMRDRRRRPKTAAVHGRNESTALSSPSSVLDILDRAREIDSMPREKMIAELERWRVEEENEPTETVLVEGEMEDEEYVRDDRVQTTAMTSGKRSFWEKKKGTEYVPCARKRATKKGRREGGEAEDSDGVGEEKSRDTLTTRRGAPLPTAAKESELGDSICDAYADATLVAMLRKRPIDVPELKSRKAFRQFFAGASRARILRLLLEAFGSDAKGKRRVQKRMALIGSTLTVAGE